MTDNTAPDRYPPARWFVLAACALWLAVWIIAVVSYAFYDKYQVPILLAVLTVPTFSIVNLILGWLPDHASSDVIVTFIGLLLGGFFQYGILGYVLGKLVQLVRMNFPR